MLALATDQMIQALIIAFSFGAFIEGAAGRIALNLLALLVQNYKH
jgi:L-lactate permease